MQGDVDQLSTAFPRLEALGVTEFFGYRDWCRGISYRRGEFASVVGERSCIYDVPPVPCDADAEAAFAEVRQALDETGVRVGALWGVEFDAGGRITYALFHLWAGDFDRFSYIYDPGGDLPETLPGELEYKRIDPDWYFEWEDWN